MRTYPWGDVVDSRHSAYGVPPLDASEDVNAEIDLLRTKKRDPIETDPTNALHGMGWTRTRALVSTTKCSRAMKCSFHLKDSKLAEHY